MKNIQEFDQQVNQALNTDSLDKLIEQEARETGQTSQNEKLEILAINSVVNGGPESLLKTFGFDNKKVTFEVERFLGKPLKKQQEANDNPQRSNSKSMKNPPVVTENPFASDLPEMT